MMLEADHIFDRYRKVGTIEGVISLFPKTTSILGPIAKQKNSLDKLASGGKTGES
jgi:hypothetical protein